MKKAIILSIAVLFATIIMAQTQKEIQIKDLPKSITEWITKNMPNNTIRRAVSTEDKGVLNYVVKVNDGQNSYFLVFDKNGKFIRKEKPGQGKNIQVPPAPPMKKTGQNDEQHKALPPVKAPTTPPPAKKSDSKTQETPQKK